MKYFVKTIITEADRTIFYKNSEETKKKNNELIEQLKKENKHLKSLRDDLQQNKRVKKLYSLINFFIF